MEYIDLGGADRLEALGEHLKRELAGGVRELRIQSGYFSPASLDLFRDTLASLAGSLGLVRVVIGSNEGSSVADDVLDLVRLMGLPRQNAGCGVVRFSGALFHPKVYHIVRSDGSQWGYVGSANMTGPGLDGRNTEAGLIVDSRQDSPQIVQKLASAIDRYFNSALPGFFAVTVPEDVRDLVLQGVLAPRPETRPPRRTGPGRSSSFPGRRILVHWRPTSSGAAGPKAVSPGPSGTDLYPPHVQFDRQAVSARVPTQGPGILSGVLLPEGAVGLIVPLSKDTLRDWSAAPSGRSHGTVNWTVPALVVPTLLFGWNGAGAGRPSIKIRWQARYVGSSAQVQSSQILASILIYGYEPGSKTNKDIRLAIPLASIRALAAGAAQHGWPVPTARDLALMEWPTPSEPVCKRRLNISHFWRAKMSHPDG